MIIWSVVRGRLSSLAIWSRSAKGIRNKPIISRTKKPLVAFGKENLDLGLFESSEEETSVEEAKPISNQPTSTARGTSREQGD